MNYLTAMQRINPDLTLKKLELNPVIEGGYIKFKCFFCEGQAATKRYGEKKNLWYCASCKKSGHIIALVMKINGIEYEDAKKLLLSKSDTAKKLTQELKLEYELEYTKAVEALGLTEDFCKLHHIGIPKGKSMLAQCLTFMVKNEKGVKIAYYGIRLKNQQHVFHKSFNKELYLWGMNLTFDGPVIVEPYLVECAKLLQEGKAAVCNFGLPYLSTTQLELLNTLERIDLKIEPNLDMSKGLNVYHRYI